jgi:capsid protein
MPYNVAAGDSGQLNFASGKLDLLPFRRSNDVDQRYFARRACRPSFEHWFEYASLIPGYLPAPPDELVSINIYGERRVEAPRTAWMWPADDTIDPREAGATMTQLQSGETTLARVHAAKGQDSEEELENGARALGITVEEYRENLIRTIWGEKQPELTPGGDVSEEGKSEKKQAKGAAA